MRTCLFKYKDRGLFFIFELGIVVAALEDELGEEGRADAGGGYGGGGDDASERVVVGVPEGIGDDGPGEVRDGRGQSEEAMTIHVVARGDLREQRVADLAPHRA